MILVRVNCIKIFFVVLVFACGHSPARASDAKGKFQLWGEGSTSCGGFISNAGKKQLGIQWMLGFLSAYNEVGYNGKDILAGTDVDGAFAWVENYCKQNPTDRLHVASAALVKFMLHKK